MSQKINNVFRDKLPVGKIMVIVLSLSAIIGIIYTCSSQEKLKSQAGIKNKVFKMNMKIGTFKVDVTPENGASLACGINGKVDSPIFIRGVIIDDSGTRIVLVSCDFIHIWGSAHEEMKKSIAKAAGTVAENVFLHSVHQHDSVRIALEQNAIYKKYNGVEITPLHYYKKINTDLELAVSQAANNLKEINGIATAERRISGLASNRRMLDENGKVYATRWSMCHDSELQKKPTGLIDSMLRSIGLIGDYGKPLAVLHFYASHPMTAYRRNMVCSDVPGAALDYAAKHYGGDAFQIYFTGCAGNITFGKYSIENKEASLKLLGKRLGREMLENCRGLEPREPGRIRLKHSSFELPLKAALNEKELLAELEKTEEKSKKIRLEMRLALVRNWEKWKKISISRISFGNHVHILSFPSETVVEYQLYAQSLIPERFLACAAYANGSYGYIPTAKMYEEGGYEPERGAITTAEAEEKMKKAIMEALKELR